MVAQGGGVAPAVIPVHRGLFVAGVIAAVLGFLGSNWWILTLGNPAGTHRELNFGELLVLIGVALLIASYWVARRTGVGWRPRGALE